MNKTSLLRWLSRSSVIRWASTMLSVVVITLVAYCTKGHSPIIQSEIFIGVVLFAGWFAGLVPGIFVGLLSTVAMNHISSISQPALDSPDFAFQLLFFLLLGAGAGCLGERQKRILETMREMRFEFETQVQGRTLELQKINESLKADIIERKLTENALRRSEAYLAEAERLSHTGSWAYDVASGVPVYWSLERCRISKYNPNRGHPTLEEYRALHTPEDWDKLMEAFNRAIRDKTDFETDSREVLSDGSARFLHIVGHPVLNAGGAVVELVGSTMDITERKQTEEALHKARTHLTHITHLTMMGELAASIAHEVNQPLAAVVTNADVCLRWLDRESPNLDEAREAVRRIIRDGNRGSDVIARIRALLKKEPPSSSRLNVNDVIKEIIALNKTGLRGVTMRIELMDKLPYISADRIHLQQVLLNLITNAVDAMKITTGRLRVLRIQTQVNAQRAVLVTVQDSGVGLDLKQIEQLFEPFYTTKPQGLGMGLSISRSIVEAHGGRLWAEPGPDSGAIFRFTLPVED
jgi:PAS domain S-box-containing protein